MKVNEKCLNIFIKRQMMELTLEEKLACGREWNELEIYFVEYFFGKVLEQLQNGDRE